MGDVRGKEEASGRRCYTSGLREQKANGVTIQLPPPPRPSPFKGEGGKTSEPPVPLESGFYTLHDFAPLFFAWLRHDTQHDLAMTPG